MRLAIVGDLHGNSQYLCNHLLGWSEMIGCDLMISVGDFGFIWPGEDTGRILDKLDRRLARANMSLLFLPGNHEDHTRLNQIEQMAYANPDGHYEIRDHIYYTGRVSSWDWEGKRFAAVGGAPSIDRDWRLDEMAHGGPRCWWPTETLFSDEVEAAKRIGKVDVLLSHDSPTVIPMTLKPDADSTAHRQVMTDIGRVLRPKLWVHGHYHRRLTYSFYHDEGMAEVHGLGCDEMDRRDVVKFVEV